MNIQTDLGPVRQTYKGLWDSAYKYETLNTVRYNGCLYICRAATSQGDIPSDSSSIWSLVSKDGVIFVTITNAPSNNKITLQGTPLYVKLSNNTIYTITADDCYVNSNGHWVLDISGVLAVNNMSEFVGPWEVYFTNTAVYDEPLINAMLDELNGEIVGVEPETKIMAAADSKNAIASFIESKGVSTVGVPFSGYVEKIDEAFETSGGAVVMEAVDRLNGEPTSANTLEAIEAAITSKEAIAEAVNTKGVSITDETTLSEYADKIRGIKAATPKVEGTPGNGFPVRFFDYDGTLLKTHYVHKGEAATPPEVPEHELLSFQQWNNPYTNIQGPTDTGALYTTKDGASYFFVYLYSDNKTIGCPHVVTNGTTTIEWGDGEVSTNSGTFKEIHTYAKPGAYVIRMTASDGATVSINDNTFSGNDFNITKTVRRMIFSDFVTYVNFQKGGTYSEVESMVFSQNTEVVRIWYVGGTFPIYIGTPKFGTIFQNMKARYVIVNRKFTKIDSFSYCRLSSFIIPDAVKDVNFALDAAIQDLVLRPVTPPSLYLDRDHFGKIYVPEGSLEAYKSATNWSAYADIMEEFTEETILW